MIILHGENIVASRQALHDKIDSLKEKEVDEIVSLDGIKLTLTEVKQALESTSLLGKARLVVIENLLSSPKNKQKEEIVNYLEKIDKKISLILWEKKELSRSSLKKLASRGTVELFKIAPIIFRFLDSISLQNKKNTLTLLHQCLKADSPEMVFYMLCRQARYLILAKDLGLKGLAGLASWQQTKFLRQAEKFSLEQLLGLHKKLLRIDYEQKTGRASLPLSSQLDLLIADL